MYIIELVPFADGSRSPLQTWEFPILPDGYVWGPDAFYDVCYSTDPAGFVEITVENNTVTAMTVNQAALEAYVAAHPVQPEAEPEPTAEDLIDAMLGVSRYE